MYDFATIGALVGIIGCEQYSAKGVGKKFWQRWVTNLVLTTEGLIRQGKYKTSGEKGEHEYEL